ncbi:MAG: DNA gyrase subunit A [Chloroflexota bacterium]|nr:DNA gyrase subunit A [Chloroflexota bacterium]
MEIGTVRRVDIEQEMQTAYLDYAMSVIVSRALPDVRDGLKPVHRRILYAMHDMGLQPGTPYRKSARIVGEVLGKYHPHGDAAVYDAMARMAQDFSLRYPLVDGQGNFGSVDGDAPAAMRYTEARMHDMGREMLADIGKDTVDFGPNFDGTLQEPSAVPSNLPNLLINGASGIAVGMATNIPPHNLGEVCDALAYMIDNYRRMDDIAVDDLMRFIHGPDFPTGGVVYRYREDGDNVVDAVRAAYAVGRGRFTVQAKAHIEEMSRGRHRIVVTELPYQTNKTNLIERIAELVRSGRIEGVADLRDESDRRGMRLVIELTRTVEPRDVLGQLFRLTPLQNTFGANMVALVDGEPRLLPLKKALEYYIEHRREIVTRRSRFELERAKHRAHVLEGLLIALSNLDEVIATIRRSRTVDSARKNLRRKFKLTEVQAQAILDMPLRRLAALERKKIEQEYKEKQKLIRHLQSLLRSTKKILGVVKDELLEMKERYGDARRTQIVERERGELTTRDLIPEEEVLVTITRRGQVRLGSPAQSRTLIAGRGKDVVVHRWQANSSDDFYLFTADGLSARLPAHQIPNLEMRPRSTDLDELCPLLKEHNLSTVLALPHYADAAPPAGYLLTVTRKGKIKRSTLAEFISAVSKDEMVIMGVDQDDELAWAHVSTGDQEIMLVTQQGKAIRFSEDEVRPMGLTAGGVMGIKLSADDQLVGADLVQSRASLLVVSSAGCGKWTSLADYPTQRRYGGGVVTYSPNTKTGELVGARVVKGQDEVWLISARGKVKRLRVRNAPRMGRATQGKVLWKLPDKDQVVELMMPMSSPGLTEKQSSNTTNDQKRASRRK